MFTIKVEKRGEQEDFRYEDVSRNACIIHEDCGGDEVKWELPEECGCPWTFYCRKCGTQIDVPSILDAKLKIVQTAIDGEEREICKEIRVIAME